MSYSTYTNILPQFPNLPQTGTTGHTTTYSLIQTHITRADSICDAKCASRYTVPFSTTPAVITTISEDLAAAMTFKSFYSQDNQNTSEYFQELWERSMLLLNDIHDGKMDLVGATAIVSEADAFDRIESTTEDYHSYFDVDSEFNWKFDDDLVDDVEDAR